MSEGNNHINYSAADIEKYCRGELPAADMHAMEKAALEDPFLADAMEGYGAGNEMGNTIIHPVQNDITELRQRLAERVNEKKTATVIKFSWWKVAAVILVFMGAAWLYTSVNNKAKMQSLVKNDEVNKKAPAPAVTDSNKDLSHTIDTLSAAGDLAVTEKKRPVKNKNITREYKKREPANDSFSIAAAISPAPATKNAEWEKSPAKSNEEYKKDLAKSFSKNDTVHQSLARLQSTRLQPADNKAVVADADKKERSIASELNKKTQGIAANDDKTTNAALAGRANNISNTFNGTVVDQLNKPVANASIQIPNLNIATVTNNNGYFSFKAPDTALSVSVASVGFETQNMDLTTNSIENANNVIRLKPSLLNLDEVTVIGYGTQKKQDLKKRKDITIHVLDAEPSVDWSTYNAYLEKNKRIPEEAKNIHGEVVVSFTVDNKNTLKNFNIQKSLNEQADAEAIRLVKEGPAWRLLKGKKAKASVIVKF